MRTETTGDMGNALSRGAATDNSPRRKSWVMGAETLSPSRGERTLPLRAAQRKIRQLPRFQVSRAFAQRRKRQPAGGLAIAGVQGAPGLVALEAGLLFLKLARQP